MLINAYGRPAYDVAGETETAMRIDLASNWWRGGPRVDPGEEKRIPLDALLGYEPGDEKATVFWCIAEGDRYGTTTGTLR